MAHPLLSASPRFYLTAAPGNGASRLSVTSARPAAHGTRRSTRPRSLSVRCEQGAKGGGGGGGLDVWLSRGAMLGFVGAVAVELTTGKGVLQNVGLTAPVPTVALALTGAVGVFTAFLIFQSASRD
ncbi:stress enhanced protein 1, chloroplastic-like [Phragmites australis]|uniref:stress enhanced protein 1, chloroplastic-like n=1 Tax=Phragmites australis TaxID=29695 RepID=UPI002D76D744|nr:stress enhanced protein 1, chloroplastic-like [Phragmites australis]